MFLLLLLSGYFTTAIEIKSQEVRSGNYVNTTMMSKLYILRNKIESCLIRYKSSGCAKVKI